MRALYAPSVSEIGPLLPAAGTAIAEAMANLAADPTPAGAAMVRAQLDGASLLLVRFREALLREAVL